jgi:hypothetical protein
MIMKRLLPFSNVYSKYGISPKAKKYLVHTSMLLQCREFIRYNQRYKQR